MNRQSHSLKAYEQEIEYFPIASKFSLRDVQGSLINRANL